MRGLIMPAMKINIKRIHIAGAIKGDAYHCMIAAAIKEKFPKVRWVMADYQTIRWTDRERGMRYKYLTPLPAQRALLKFDRGEPVAPFTIGLSAPILRHIHPLTRRVEKPNKAKRKAPNTARYKHKKVAPEAAAARIYGMRALGEN